MIARMNKTTIVRVLFLSFYSVFSQTKANWCYDGYCPHSEYCCKHYYEFSECGSGCAGFPCDDDTDCAANEFCSFADSKCQVKVDLPSKASADADESEGMPGWVIALLVILVIAAFLILMIAIVIYRCCYLSSRRRPHRCFRGVIVVHPLNTDTTVLAVQQQQQIELQEPQKQHQQQQNYSKEEQLFQNPQPQGAVYSLPGVVQGSPKQFTPHTKIKKVHDRCC